MQQYELKCCFRTWLSRINHATPFTPLAIYLSRVGEDTATFPVCFSRHQHTLLGLSIKRLTFMVIWEQPCAPCSDLAFISSAERGEELTNMRNILVHMLHLESNSSPPHEWQRAPISVLFANARSNKETKLAFWNTVPDGSYWWYFSDSLKDNQIDFLSLLVHIFSLC